MKKEVNPNWLKFPMSMADISVHVAPVHVCMIVCKNHGGSGWCWAAMCIMRLWQFLARPAIVPAIGQGAHAGPHIALVYI